MKVRISLSLSRFFFFLTEGNEFCFIIEGASPLEKEQPLFDVSSRRDGFRETIYRIPFWRRRSKNATDRVDVLGGGGLLLLRKGRRQRRLTHHHHHHHHHRRHTLGADQIEFVYLYSPSSSSFAGMRLSLSSRRSETKKNDLLKTKTKERPLTNTTDFLFPNHNRVQTKTLQALRARRPPKRVLRNRAKDSRGES